MINYGIYKNGQTVTTTAPAGSTVATLKTFEILNGAILNAAVSFLGGASIVASTLY